MKEFSIIVGIDAPPERVWEIMIAVEQWHEWTPSIRRIKPLSDRPFAVGSRYLIFQPKLPPALWKVTELIPGRTFTWTAGGPGMLVSGKHSVMPSERGSLASLSLQYSGIFGPFLAWLMRKINDRYLNFEATGLTARSEHRM